MSSTTPAVLADACWPWLVARVARWGAYTRDGVPYTAPATAQRTLAVPPVLTPARLATAFTAAPGTALGLHPIGDGTRDGDAAAGLVTWGALDLDAHMADPRAAARQNLILARAFVARARAAGYPILVEDSNGVGGLHLWLRSTQAGPAPSWWALLHDWRHAVATHDLQDATLARRVEQFPKAAWPDLTTGGNWIRLPGHHPRRPHVSRVALIRPDDRAAMDVLDEAVEAAVMRGADGLAHLDRMDWWTPTWADTLAVLARWAGPEGAAAVRLPAGPPAPAVTPAVAGPSITPIGPLADAWAWQVRAAIIVDPRWCDTQRSLGDGRNAAYYGLAARLLADLRADLALTRTLCAEWNAMLTDPLTEAQAEAILQNAVRYARPRPLLTSTPRPADRPVEAVAMPPRRRDPRA